MGDDNKEEMATTWSQQEAELTTYRVDALHANRLGFFTTIADFQCKYRNSTHLEGMERDSALMGTRRTVSSRS